MAQLFTNPFYEEEEEEAVTAASEDVSPPRTEEAVITDAELSSGPLTNGGLQPGSSTESMGAGALRLPTETINGRVFWIDRRERKGNQKGTYLSVIDKETGNIFFLVENWSLFEHFRKKISV